MKTPKFNPDLEWALKLLMVVLFCSYSFNNATSQTIRSYATRQAVIVSSTLTGQVQNPGYATDNDPSTMSTLTQSASLFSSANTEQILDFNPNPSSTATYPGVIAANTPVTVKIELPSAILDVVDQIEVQAVTGLNKPGSNWTYTNVGTALTGASLLAVLSGNGSNEVTITPNVPFQGIRVRVYEPTLLSNTAGVYHAYINVPASGNIACSKSIDILSGVRPATLLGGVLSTTASVSDPWNAVDSSLATYAQLSTGIDVMNEVYHTTIFNTLSKVGDSLKIRLRGINGALLSIGALTGFRIKLYNNKTLVQTIMNDPSLLSLTLLDPLNNIMELSAVPTGAFDRVEIVIGGVMNAFSGVRIYDVKRKNAGVALTNAQAQIYVYAGQSYTLSATPIATGDSVVFFDAATNGSMVSAGPTATVAANGGAVWSFYAGALRNGCLESSDRRLINVHVIGFIRDMPDTGYVGQYYSSDIIVTDTNSTPQPPHMHYMAMSALPAGLSMDLHTGLITGMPTSAAPVPPLTVTISDEGNNMLVGTFSYPIVIRQSIPLSKSFELNAAVAGNQVLLNWVTHTENANAGFTIQRSTDGNRFTAIATVNSKYKGGTGAGEMKYDFTDGSPLAGSNYYRLVQTDLNGELYYSNIVSAFIDMRGNVLIYPNPVRNILNIQAANTNAVYIYNAAGQLVSSKVYSMQNNPAIDVSYLANGVYAVMIEGPAINSIQRFIVCH